VEACEEEGAEAEGENGSKGFDPTDSFVGGDYAEAQIYRISWGSGC
jgi:hypothetical protein